MNGNINTLLLLKLKQDNDRCAERTYKKMEDEQKAHQKTKLKLEVLSRYHGLERLGEMEGDTLDCKEKIRRLEEELYICNRGKDGLEFELKKARVDNRKMQIQLDELKQSKEEQDKNYRNLMGKAQQMETLIESAKEYIECLEKECFVSKAKNEKKTEEFTKTLEERDGTIHQLEEFMKKMFHNQREAMTRHRRQEEESQQKIRELEALLNVVNSNMLKEAMDMDAMIRMLNEENRVSRSNIETELAETLRKHLPKALPYADFRSSGLDSHRMPHPTFIIPTSSLPFELSNSDDEASYLDGNGFRMQPTHSRLPNSVMSSSVRPEFSFLPRLTEVRLSFETD